MHKHDYLFSILEADAFTGLNNLRSLNLTKNNLWTVPSSTFCGLHSLRFLNLSVNFLQDANELGFTQNCNIPLEKLDLSQNSLASIPTNAFSQLISLEVLRLDNNRLNVLEDQAFGGLVHLKTLSLANNQLGMVSYKMSIDTIYGTFKTSYAKICIRKLTVFNILVHKRE